MFANIVYLTLSHRLTYSENGKTKLRNRRKLNFMFGFSVFFVLVTLLAYTWKGSLSSCSRFDSRVFSNEDLMYSKEETSE